MRVSHSFIFSILVFLLLSGQIFAQSDTPIGSPSQQKVASDEVGKVSDGENQPSSTDVVLSNTIIDGVECSVSASVDKVCMYIGDIANYTIQATVPKGWSPDLGKAGPLLDKSGFEIRDFFTPEASEDFTNARSFVFSTFTTGTYLIPSVPVEIIQKEGGKGNLVLATRPLTIEVIPVPPIPGEADDIRDIKGAMSIPVPSMTAFLLTVSAIILVIFFVVYVLRRRGDSIEETVITPLNAYEIAISQYQKLTSDYVAGEIDVKIFHYGLSEILRLYLEGRYSFTLLSETTMELMESLRAADFDKSLYSTVESILEEADLVKFARFVPTDEETEHHASSLLNFIHDTKPSEDQGVAGEAEGNVEGVVEDDDKGNAEDDGMIVEEAVSNIENVKGEGQ